MRNIRFTKEIKLSEYDLYVIPCNCMMEALDTFNKKLIKSIYRKKLVDGDIKISGKYCANKSKEYF